MGDGAPSFAFKGIIFALVITIGMSIMINLFAPPTVPLNQDEALSGYYDFTGSQPSSESIWVLKGIYTPYGINPDGSQDTTHYGYTDDGWLYGYRIQNYTPSQYRGSSQSYLVSYVDGMYRYNTTQTDPEPVKNETVVTTYGNHKYWDLYTDVCMSKDKQSQIFFTPDLKTETADGHFYYNFSGYRYSFGPTANFHSADMDGNNIEVIASTTSLSLIWYNYYVEENSGIAGQLIISSQDYEVAYLTAPQIIQAFNSTTSTSKFVLNFRGVPVNLYIKLDPYQLQQGMSVEDCYNNGFWSVMVTATSTDSSAYTESSYGINASNILNTIMDLFTFNYADYGISVEWGIVCSLLIVVPFYAFIIAIIVGTESYKLLIIVGILAVLETIASVMSNFGGLF